MGFDGNGIGHCLLVTSAGVLHDGDDPNNDGQRYLVFRDVQTTNRREAVVTEGLTHAIIYPTGNHILIDLRNPILTKTGEVSL